MGQELEYDVFLSHSAKDNAVLRRPKERLRQNVPLSGSQAFGGLGGPVGVDLQHSTKSGTMYRVL